MIKKATYLLAACLMLLLAGLFTPIDAQQSNLGVVWEPPADTYAAHIEIENFRRLGVSHIEIVSPVDENLKPILRDSSFTFLIRSHHTFLTVSTLKERKSSLKTSVIELINEYNSFPRIAGLGLVTHSQTSHPDFIPTLNTTLSTINQPFERTFYFVKNQNWYRLSNPEIAFGTIFNDNNYQRSDLENFSGFMSASDQNTITFIHSSWLLNSLIDYPEIEEAFHEYNTTGNWELPNPDLNENTLKANWMVLVLIFLWASLTLQIRFLPYVGSAIFRYFFAHRFFVDDILGYRERAVAGGVLQMIAHATFGGLVFFMASHLVFSDLGLEAIFYHFPWLTLAGQSYSSFFILGFGSILMLDLIAILWLHLPAKNLTHISQTLNLYSGIFYIDYFLVTIMLTLFTAGAGNIFTLGFAVTFLLICLLSFYITAFDIGQNNRENKALYLLLTIALHSILFILVILSILLFTDVYSVLQLAASL